MPGNRALKSVRSLSVQNHFGIEESARGNASLLVLSGELDLASSGALEEALERAERSGVGLVIVDLRELDFMDSTGLSVLVRAHQRAAESGTRFVLVKGTPQVQRLLDLTGVAERLAVVETPEELLA